MINPTSAFSTINDFLTTTSASNTSNYVARNILITGDQKKL